MTSHSTTPQKGDRVIANVSLDIPCGYAAGADDPIACDIPATVYEVEGAYGIGWCVVQLDDGRDHDRFPADFQWMPLDRLVRS